MTGSESGSTRGLHKAGGDSFLRFWSFAGDVSGGQTVFAIWSFSGIMTNLLNAIVCPSKKHQRRKHGGFFTNCLGLSFLHRPAECFPYPPPQDLQN